MDRVELRERAGVEQPVRRGHGKRQGGRPEEEAGDTQRRQPDQDSHRRADGQGGDQRHEVVGMGGDEQAARRARSHPDEGELPEAELSPQPVRITREIPMMA